MFQSDQYVSLPQSYIPWWPRKVFKLVCWKTVSPVKFSCWLHGAHLCRHCSLTSHLWSLSHQGEEGPGFDSTVDNSVILYLVDRGAQVNSADTYGCTPLHFAAMRGNEVATKELLMCKGINIEVQSESLASVLQKEKSNARCWFEWSQEISIFTSRQRIYMFWHFFFQAVDKQQMTVLHMAASHDEVEVCRMLIERGANLRCCDEDTATPLHYACQEGSVQVVQMLFEAGERQDGWVTVQRVRNFLLKVLLQL